MPLPDAAEPQMPGAREAGAGDADGCAASVSMMLWNLRLLTLDIDWLEQHSFSTPNKQNINSNVDKTTASLRNISFLQQACMSL
jgi:hypothetical protein